MSGMDDGKSLFNAKETIDTKLVLFAVASKLGLGELVFPRDGPLFGARGSHYFTHLALTQQTNIRNISSRARQALVVDKGTAGLVPSPSHGHGVPRSSTLRGEGGDTESLEAGWELSTNSTKRMCIKAGHRDEPLCCAGSPVQSALLAAQTGLSFFPTATFHEPSSVLAPGPTLVDSSIQPVPICSPIPITGARHAIRGRRMSGQGLCWLRVGHLLLLLHRRCRPSIRRRRRRKWRTRARGTNPQRKSTGTLRLISPQARLSP